MCALEQSSPAGPAGQLRKGVHAEHPRQRIVRAESRTKRLERVDRVGRSLPIELDRIDAETIVSASFHARICKGELHHAQALPSGRTGTPSQRRLRGGNESELIAVAAGKHFKRCIEMSSMDRIERAENQLDAESSKLRAKLDQAIHILLSSGGDRAERLQRLFSRDYEDQWRSDFGL